MLWMENIAQRILREFPDRGCYHCQCGLSTTGLAHFGNYREIVITYAVARAIQRTGNKADILLSFDDYDRYKKLATGTPEHYQQYIGKPCSKIPSPYDASVSYAQYYEMCTLNNLESLSIPVYPLRQQEKYEGQIYRQELRRVLLHRAEIFNIISSYKTQSYSEEDQTNFMPVTVYCGSCGKDSTSIIGYDPETEVLHYRCCCGNEEKAPFYQLNIKAIFKVDWPMRWAIEQVSFEAAGKSHCEPNGALAVSSEICKSVFHQKPPVSARYEFVSNLGQNGRMSKTSGSVLTMENALRVFGRDMVLWLLGAVNPSERISISIETGVHALYKKYENFLRSNDPDDVLMRAILQITEPAGLPDFSAICIQLATSELPTEVMLERMGYVPSLDAINKFERVAYWMERVKQIHCYRIKSRPLQSLSVIDRSLLHTLLQCIQQGSDPDQILEMLSSVAGDEWKKCSAVLNYALFSERKGPPIRRILRFYPLSRIQERLQEVLSQ